MALSKGERIRKAAVQVFASKGFYNAKIAEIAQKANVATGTVYLYYKSKDDILISIFEQEMTPIIERVQRELNKENNTIDKLHKFAFLHLDMVERNQDLAQLFQVELRQSSRFIHEYAGTKFKEYLNIISRIVEERQDKGELRKDIHPAVFKQIFFGALDEMSTNWLLTKVRKHTLISASEQISRVFIEGMSTLSSEKKD